MQKPIEGSNERIEPYMMETYEKPFYPFTAIVGKDRAKLGLMLNAIDPTIGGIIVTGPKGSGKSTLVRAAAKIFPDVETVVNCKFNCTPADPTNMCDDCQARLKAQGFLPTERRHVQFVQIPIGATEDRIVGSVDVERALKDGLKALHPGLLAESNHGILYLDETNLIPDHLVDVILDASASGWNIIEREGVSCVHPSRFILIGTMNPEEGELRPQLMDRFGLHVHDGNIGDPEQRVEIIRRNLEFTANPDSFIKKYDVEEAGIRQAIAEARELLPKVVVSSSTLDFIARVHHGLRVDGYRPDIVAVKAAKAHAALERRCEVTPEDVKVAMELTLTHRTRRSGLKEPPSIQEIGTVLQRRGVFGEAIRKLGLRSLRLSVPKGLRAGGQTMSPLAAILIVVPALLLLVLSYQRLLGDFGSPLPTLLIVLVSLFMAAVLGRLARGTSSTQIRLLDLSKITSVQGKISQVVVEDSEGTIRTPSLADLDRERNLTLETMRNELNSLKDLPKDIEPFKTPKSSSKDEKARRGKQYLVGKRAKIVTSTAKGRYTFYELPKTKPWDVAFVPTLRSASLFQKKRKMDGLSIVVKPEDIRVKVREYRAPFSIVLLVDMSFSMANSLVNIGRAVFSLHRSVYRRRDRVSLVVFKGKDAVVLQQPTTNLDMVVGKLRKIGTSDFTPMATGLLRAWRLLRLEKQRNSDVVPMLIIISDGIVNVPLSQPLSATSRKEYMSEAQADVMDMARILKRDGIGVIVINTSHRENEIPGDLFKKLTSPMEWYTPTELMLELAQVMDGSYYGLSLSSERLGEVKKSRLEDWFYFEDRS